MIIYKNKGLSFVPQKLWGLVNLYTIFFMILFTGWIWLGIIDNWSFIVWFFAIWLAVGVLTYLFTVRRPMARVIETKSDSLYIVWTKYFSIKTTEIKNEDVKIEYYKSPYRGRFGTANVYLYFYSRTDESVDVELKESFHVLGKIIESIHQEQMISLGKSELEFLEEYRKQLKFEQTTWGKIAQVLVPGVLIVILLLIVYTCRDGG